jgi:hypothetical protein
MYFTDRIFIVVLNFAICVKCISFIIDQKVLRERGREGVNWGKMELEKGINRVDKRILYLISPYPVYHKFVE